MCRQTQHPGRCYTLFQSPQTPAALLTSAGRSLAYLGGIPYGSRPCPHPGPSIQSSPGPRTHLPANPAASLRLALWPSRAAHSRFIHRPSRSRRVGVVASPPPPMAARFGRAQAGGDSGRGGAEQRGGAWAGQGQRRGRDLAGALRAVISFCWGALWRLQTRKGGPRLGSYGSGLTASAS